MSDDLFQRLRAPMWRFVPPDVARVADAAADELTALRARRDEVSRSGRRGALPCSRYRVPTVCPSSAPSGDSPTC